MFCIKGLELEYAVFKRRGCYITLGFLEHESTEPEILFFELMMKLDLKKTK